jgi:LacI family transcriptional regulator
VRRWALKFGRNDIPIVSRLGTLMTTVRLPFDQVAIAALDLLHHDPDQGRIMVATPALIPRRSTATPKSR